LKDHKIQGKIRESAAREQRQFDLGELVLVGTNAFQDKGERMKEQVEINLHGVKDRRQTIVEPILEKRLAEKVELKRLADE
jgi:methylmalonyl-CoA mutase